MGKLLRIFAGGFTPLSIPSLALWLDAQDYATLTFNSTTISQWNDKSGKGNHALQGTSGLQPLYANGIHARPTLQFYHNATASNLTVADHATLNYSTFTAYVVARPTQMLGANMHLLAKWTISGNQREFKLPILTSSNVLNGQCSADGSAVTNNTTTPVLAVDTNYIFEFGYNGSLIHTSINRANEMTTALGAVFNGSSPLFVGTRDTTTEPFAGHIGEIRFFTGALSASQRLSNYQDLARKWSITIS